MNRNLAGFASEIQKLLYLNNFRLQQMLKLKFGVVILVDLLLAKLYGGLKTMIFVQDLKPVIYPSFLKALFFLDPVLRSPHDSQGKFTQITLNFETNVDKINQMRFTVNNFTKNLTFFSQNLQILVSAFKIY